MADLTSPPSRPVTVAVAAAVEAEPLTRRIGNAGRVLVAGVGRAGDEPLRDALRSGPGTVINLGFAGALEPELRPGESIVTSGWIDPAPPHSEVAAPDPSAKSWLLEVLSRRGIAARTGPGITVESPFHDAAEGRRIHRSSGALTVEMEGARWAAIARAAGHAFVAVRVVSDHADRSLPLPRHRLLTGDGDIRWDRWLRSLGPEDWLRLPAALRRLLRARSDWSAALAGLDDLADAIVGAVAPPAVPSEDQERSRR